MSIPAPSDNPKAWDRVDLGSLRLPGICVVKVKLADEVQKAKAKGKSGASTTFLGANVAGITIKCTMHGLLEGTADFDRAVDVMTELLSTRGEPREISHPITKLFGVKRVLIEAIEGEHNGQEIVLSFSLSEFAPSKKSGSVTKTPTSLDPRNQILGPDLPSPPKRPSTSGAALP